MTVPPLPVVIGHDGTAASSGALRFAAAEARRRGAPLRVVHAMALETSAYLEYQIPIEEISAQRDQVASRLRAEVARAAQDLDGEVTVYGGPAAGVLLDSAGHACMLVVGRETRHGLEQVFGRATTNAVAAHAQLVLVVVPEDWQEDSPRRHRIVVAIKGREHATELLGEAFRAAADSGSCLRVVHAWGADRSIDGDRPDDWTPAVLLAQRAGTALEELLTPWREAFPAVPVTVEVLVAPARACLVEETVDADLLVVLRGVSATLGPHLGHVLRPLLRVSACPVLVVPPRDAALPPLDLEMELAGSLLS